jgi:hypothetical protein
LFATLDGGDTWFRMKNNIPEYALVRDLQINPITNDLIVATHGRGIFILDDIRPIRNLTKDIWEKDVYLFPTPEIKLNNGRFGWGGPEVSGGWGAGNPQETPSIDYYLKQRLASGKVTVEIYDEQGKLVQSIPGGIRKGINKVYWNLRSTPPKVAAGSTKMDGAGFIAPMVMPGKYTVKLKIKDTEYTDVISCVHDAENKDLTAEDRKLVNENAQRLLTLYNNVSNMIDTITFYQAELKKDSVSFAKNKNNKLFYTELEKTRAELMATKQTSIFADEERLREKVSSLYGTFCSMEAKPNSTQLEAIDVLKSDLKKQEEQLAVILKKYKKYSIVSF